jgi:hypothetical protein
VLVSVVLIPGATLIVVFLKRTDIARFQKQEDALNGLGERVNRVEIANARLQEQYSTLQTQIAGSQRDILEAIRSSSLAQLTAVHAIELQVERLKLLRRTISVSASRSSPSRSSGSSNAFQTRGD